MDIKKDKKRKDTTRCPGLCSAFGGDGFLAEVIREIILGYGVGLEMIICIWMVQHHRLGQARQMGEASWMGQPTIGELCILNGLGRGYGKAELDPSYALRLYSTFGSVLLGQ